MIKMIFSDMDGTLLDDAGQLPAEFGEVLAELHRRGVSFAPASGRQYFALRQQFAAYADKLIFLAENGAYVVRQGKELFSNVMERALADVVLTDAAKLEPQGIYPVLCGKQSAYVKSHNQVFLDEMGKYYTQYTFVDDFSAVEDEIIKISLCDAASADAERTIYPRMQICQDRLQTVLSSNYWVDIMNADNNKGAAIRQLQRILGLQPEECAAFGDYLNDLEMMQAVHYSYAMANAHPEVRQAARFQAPSNAEHGVIKTIRGLMDKNLL